ncbi:MAG: hypothetical protein MR210_07490 [Erysipelotrichaceae bacterium]|nr:hypothetical protein [Erysipelotrichaceae bacterium]MDY5251498.1 hypothetical protein [Erysipelotrichaceae bacterium]
MSEQEKYLSKAHKILKLKKWLLPCLIIAIIAVIISFNLLNNKRTMILTYLNFSLIITTFVAIIGYVYYKLFSENILYYCQNYDNNPEGVKRKVRLSYFGASLCAFALIASFIGIIFSFILF